MSADNAIFILDHPKGYAVVHYTLSPMPYSINRIFREKKGIYQGDELHVFSGKDAYNRANAMARVLARQEEILEYGIIDWRNPERLYKPEFHEHEWKK